MRQRPSTDMRAQRGSVFVLALLVLSATHHACAGSVKSVGGASPVCPAGFQLAANSSVCAQRLEANATISYAEAQLSCYETYAQLAEPFVTDVASCTASPRAGSVADAISTGMRSRKRGRWCGCPNMLTSRVIKTMSRAIPKLHSATGSTLLTFPRVATGCTAH